MPVLPGDPVHPLVRMAEPGPAPKLEVRLMVHLGERVFGARRSEVIGPALANEGHGERGAVTPFLRPVFRSRRAVLSTGFAGVNAGRFDCRWPHSRSRFGQAC